MDACSPSASLDAASASRYLRLLRVEAKVPSFEALAELVVAHLVRVPFENVSKLFNRKHYGLETLPSPELFLQGIEHYNFGGTCYSNNFYFYSLLAALGYEVKLCSADMRNPDVHMVIVARMEEREYLIDGGYGAPFLHPLPRDLQTDYAVELGRDRYVLKPQDAKGCSRMELHREGVAKHGYRMKPQAKSLADFQPAIAHSFRPEATFLNSLLLVRFYPGSSIVLHNGTLIESSGTESRTTVLPGRRHIPAAVEQHFGIPARIAEEVVSELPMMQDAWA